MSTCLICDQPISAGERRVDTYARDERGNAVDRRPVHLDHLVNGSDNG